MAASYVAVLVGAALITLHEIVASNPGAAVAAECAFGTYLLGSDLTDRTIMWGHGGVLRGRDVLDRSGGGLGLRLDPAAVLVPLELTSPSPRARRRRDCGHRRSDVVPNCA